MQEHEGRLVTLVGSFREKTRKEERRASWLRESQAQAFRRQISEQRPV